jgi:hypothetical protein
MQEVVVADDGNIEAQFELVRDRISNVTARFQEPKGLREGRFANDIESEVINPFVKMDAAGRSNLGEAGELLTEEGDALVNVRFALENVTERVTHGDIPGTPNHLFVVGLRHGINISRVRKTKYFVPVRL